MAYVPVPKDLTRIKTKVAFNLTQRQLICFSVAALIGIPSYLINQSILGSTGAVIVMICLMLPFFFLAMFEKDGQPAEKIALQVIRVNLWLKARPYRTANLYLFLESEGKAMSVKEVSKTDASITPSS